MNMKQSKMILNEIVQLRHEAVNQSCANCKSTSVPYVCLDFGTFVCTRCAALHRDLQHRVKSLTASTFKQEEVDRIAGNQEDKNKYLARWNV